MFSNVGDFKSWQGLIAAVAIALSFAATDARSQVLLDTFAPGDTAPGPDYLVYRESSFPNRWQMLAVPFTATSAVTVDSILVAITKFPGNIGYVTLGIESDLAGLPSDIFLYSSNLTDPVANFALNGLGWALDAGSYWLVADPSLGFEGTWWGGVASIGTHWGSRGDNSPSWFPQENLGVPAARITAIPAVPEPDTYAMLLAGLGLLGFTARRRQRKHA